MPVQVFDVSGRLKVSPGLVDLATNVTGVLPVANGGTGIATLTANRIPFGNGTSPLQSDADLTFDGSTLTLNGLLDLSGAAGGQIKFPATQNPSANANTLDDYEEGTWTPTDGSGGGLTFAVTSANYTKIGRQVSITLHLAWPVTADTNNVKVNGLPFTSLAYSGLSIGFNNNGATVNFAVPNGSAFLVAQSTAGVGFTNAQFSNSTFVLAGAYFV